MLKLYKDKEENVNMVEFFDKETEEWRSKMIKVFGDQHPYSFYVTSGHDFEDIILKVIDVDAPARESQKLEPFKNLKEMTEIDRRAAKEFYQLLSEIEKESPTLELKEALEQKKKECAKVFDMFDEIVSICEDYFELEYSDCRKRVSKHIAFQKPIINEVEKFLIEVEEFGNAELKSLQEKISKWVYNKGLSMLDSIDESYHAVTDQPIAMSVWFDGSAALTSKEIRHAFLADQKEMSSLWKKAFNDLLICTSSYLQKIPQCS